MQMTTQQKLEILADAAKYDASCASSGAKRGAVPGGLGNSDGTGICHSYTPDGRCVSLLKILLTNVCTYDCVFCVNRVSSDIQRARFTPEEVVSLTLDFYKRNYIEGLFLSSGIIQSPDYTMEQLVSVARQLRQVHKFGGYIHLKDDSGVRSGADRSGRASMQIGFPRTSSCRRRPTWCSLRRRRRLRVIETTMQQIQTRKDESDEERKQSRLPSALKPAAFAAAGQSTQMVVGATDTSDRQILSTADPSVWAVQVAPRVLHGLFALPGGGCAAAAEADASDPGASSLSVGLADALLRLCGDGADGRRRIRAFR